MHQLNYMKLLFLVNISNFVRFNLIRLFCVNICYSYFGFEKYSYLQLDCLKAWGTKNYFQLCETFPILHILCIQFFWPEMDTHLRNVINIYSLSINNLSIIHFLIQVVYHKYQGNFEAVYQVTMVTFRIVRHKWRNEKKMMKL